MIYSQFRFFGHFRLQGIVSKFFYCFQVSTRNLRQVTKNSDGNSKRLNNSVTLNHGDLQSIFESTAIKLIDEYFGFDDLDFELGDHRRETIEQTRLGYPQRTLHLSNEYDMVKKKWDLENTLKVMVYGCKQCKTCVKHYGGWSALNGSRLYPMLNDLISIYRKFFLQAV